MQSSSALHEAYALFVKKDYEKAYQVLQNKANHSSQQLHNATLLMHGFVAPNADALFHELEQIAPKITEPKTSDMARYNQALLCLQFRRMELANKYLMALRQKLEKMDEYLAVRVCFTILEVLFHTAAPSAQEITGLLEFVERTCKKLISSTTTTSPDSQAQQAPTTLHVQDIKLAYHLYKFRWHTLQHDIASAEKELISATGISKNKTVTYQAQLSFLKNIADSADNMFTLLDGATMEHACSYWNNTGCILSKHGKHHCAYLCFTKAYSFAQQSTTIAKQNMLISCLNNMALSLLTDLKRPLDAFHLFAALVQDKPNYARYWIRLAECCVSYAHQNRNLHSSDFKLVKNQQTDQAIYVRLPTKPLFVTELPLVTPATTKNTTLASIVNSHFVDQDKLLFQAGPSLLLAEKCLKNASSLAIHHTVDMLFIYCKLAHVYLLLDDPALCVFYAYKILKSKAQQHPAMTSAMIVQLVMHTSEALCKMDKYAEALSLIQSHLSEAPSFTMHTIVTLIMNQQLEKAQLLCKSLPPSNHATLLQIYIYMYSGNRQALWNMFHGSNNT